MTINPVDMQVLLPKLDQAQKTQRGLVNQQQTEQQVMSQLIEKEMNRKQQVINQLKQTQENKLDKEKKEEKRRGSSPPKEVKERDKNRNSEETEGLPGNKDVGCTLDIKV